MKTRFMKRNFMFVFFSFVLIIFSYSTIDAAYNGNVGDTIEDGECLTFVADQDDSWVSLGWISVDAVQYNKNDSGWTTYPERSRIYLKQNEYVKFRGSGLKLAEKVGDTIYSGGAGFVMGGSISVTGCVDSLRLKSLDTNSPDYVKFQGLDVACYYGMFANIPRDNPCLKTAPELRATTLSEYCYVCMFCGCKNLTSAPALPARSLPKGCYQWMFSACTNLENPPALPATSITAFCYCNMFRNCASLNLSTTRDSNHQYTWTFKKGDESMLPNGMLSRAAVDTNGYVTLYSKYPLSSSVSTTPTIRGTLKYSAKTDDRKNSKFLTFMIQLMCRIVQKMCATRIF